MKKTTLTIIRGLPGSGKTTLAVKLALDEPGSAHYEADMYFMDENCIYNFDKSKLKLARAECLKLTKEALENGHDVFVSNTFSKKWEVQPYLDLGYPVFIIERQNDYGSIHGVPESVINKLRDRRESLK